MSSTPRQSAGSLTTRELSRPLVCGVLIALMALSFGLRVWEFRYGLPSVLHSDYIQVTQAAQFLRDGSFVERSSYPVTHTWAYVAANVMAFALDRVLELADWKDWADFVRAVQLPGLHHAIGRLYTAFVGAWLALGVYLLSRVRFSRGTALLAAAIAAFCPALVIYSHQVRIHVPGITLLAFAAVPLLRLVLPRADAIGDGAPEPGARVVRLPFNARPAIVAGAAAGVVASVFQLGFVLLAAGGLLLVCLRRPLRRMLREGVTVAAAFTATFLVITLAAHWPGIVRDPAGAEQLKGATTLGIPGSFLGFHFADRFASFVRNYVMIEPVRVAAVLALLLPCWRGRRSFRDAFAYGAYPLLLLLILGTNYTEVRYSMSASVFLAPLAAAGCLALASRPARIILASLLILAPLASCVRANLLLQRGDTRESLQVMLRELTLPHARIAVESRLVLNRSALPASVVQFPPDGNFKPWYLQGVLPSDTLKESKAILFVRTKGQDLQGRLTGAMLQSLGYWCCAVGETGARSQHVLPDAPDDLAIELWRVQRPGPALEVWCRTEEARDYLHWHTSGHELVLLARR